MAIRFQLAVLTICTVFAAQASAKCPTHSFGCNHAALIKLEQDIIKNPPTGSPREPRPTTPPKSK